jgi:cell division septation protein DedD
MSKMTELWHKSVTLTRLMMAAVAAVCIAFIVIIAIPKSPSGPRSPPIIRADTSPTKVIPTKSDANTKPQLGDSSGERLVRREEDPIDFTRDRLGADGQFHPRPRTVPSQRPASQDRTASTQYRLADQTAGVPPPSAGGTPAITPGAPAGRAPSTGEAGSYLVQLSARKSEAEAQAEFRSLQSNYSILSGRQLLIRRKDQGERGAFYATQVGPFGSKGDADQFCKSLKSAGGSCFVTRN